MGGFVHQEKEILIFRRSSTIKLKQITSIQNPAIKELILLQSKSKIRREKKCFSAEGLNEIRLAIKYGYTVKELYFNQERLNFEELGELLDTEVSLISTTAVSENVFGKIAYRSGVKNAVAILEQKMPLLEDFQIPDSGLIVVVSGLEKPGNLGAILRSCDAMGVSAVLLADSKIDVFNPNVIRSSVGCVFTIGIFQTGNLEAIDFLRKNQFTIYTTFMSNSIDSWNIDYPPRTAVVVGSENKGLESIWRQKDFVNINVPMFGGVDSLNVSVATSLLIYEVSRKLRTQKK